MNYDIITLFEIYKYYECAYIGATMTKIFTKLRAMVDDALNERSPIIEQDTTLMTAPVERELF